MGKGVSSEENVLLTVVVPVYKTEEFLERCFNSLFGSEYQELEILLIDDGSPDRCPAICDAYAARDQRARVFHRENGGSYKAKNVGIENARGKYIAFCDSDDFVPDDAYRLMMDKAIETDADVIRGIVRRTYTDTGDVRLFYRKETDSFMTRLVGFQGAIYKTEMLRQNRIRFQKFRLGEDMCFMAQVVNFSNKTVYIDAVTYEYMMRPSNSGEASAVQKKMKDFLYYYDEFRWREWVLSYVLEHEKLKNAYGGELGVFCMAITEVWLDYSEEERQKCFEVLQKIVNEIDWDQDTANAKGYLQVELQKFRLMDEKAYTKHLKREFVMMRPFKKRIKKLFGKN